MKDLLQRRERLLEHFVPMVVSQFSDDGDQHIEGERLVLLDDLDEGLTFEETHGTVGHLQVRAGDAADNSLEEAGDQRFQFISVAEFEDFRELLQEKGFLDEVGEGPVLEDTFEQGDGQRRVLSKEEHRASDQVIEVDIGGLNLVQRDDDVLEENHVLFP